MVQSNSCVAWGIGLNELCYHYQNQGSMTYKYIIILIWLYDLIDHKQEN